MLQGSLFDFLLRNRHVGTHAAAVIADFFFD